jgi:hypothetical protein
MLRLRGAVVVVGVVMLALAQSAWAQVEPIFSPVPEGPVGVTFVFPNVIPPNPDRKLLHFHGAADSNGFPFSAFLGVSFDWLLPSGGTDVSPTTTFLLSPFISNPVDMLWLVDFCPSEVSLHFTTTSPPGATVSGTFEHTCLTVPEPGSLGMIALAGACVAVMRRRRV